MTSTVRRRLQVHNTTRGCLLAIRAELATGFLQRAVGLMGRRDWSSADGLVIDPCNGVHTILMRLPLDVVYVSAEGSVLRAVHDLRPWRLGPIVRGSRWVLEAPAGTIAGTSTSVGDRLELRTVVE